MDFTKVELEIRCPNCGEKYKVKLGDIKPGNSIECTKCKTKITFTGDDISKVTKEIEKVFKNFQRLWKR